MNATETILLVEDAPAVLEYTLGVLSDAGYRVLETGSAHDAIRMAETYAPHIHLLITDVVMPKMNGRQLAGHIMARRPGIRLLFMSAYDDTTVLHNGVLQSGVPF